MVIELVNIVLYSSVWIHVISAIIWLGSVIAMEFIILPALNNNIGPNNSIFLSGMSKKYARVSEITSALILITGVYQTYANGYLDVNKLFSTGYGNLVLVKVMLFFIFAGVGVSAGMKLAHLDSTSSNEQILQGIQKAKMMFLVDIIVGLFIIVVAVALSFGGSITI